MINICNLNKRYAERTQAEVSALSGIDLEIAAGEFVSIQGPSGCGKSTLLNIIGLLDLPSSGHYYLDGLDVASIKDKAQAELRNEKIGFVVQDFALIGNESVFFNIGLPMMIKNEPKHVIKYRCLEIMDQLGIADQANKLVRNLSGGQRQRVAIARALINTPSIILADEPTGSLDQKTAAEVMKLLSDLNHQFNLTVLLVTHDIEVSNYATKHLHMLDGRLIK